MVSIAGQGRSEGRGSPRKKGLAGSERGPHTSGVTIAAGSVIPPPTRPIRVAVVDDHKDIRDLVGRYLGEHGYRVSAVENAAAMRRPTMCSNTVSRRDW